MGMIFGIIAFLLVLCSVVEAWGKTASYRLTLRNRKRLRRAREARRAC